MADDVHDRLDRLETELAALRAELAAVRQLVPSPPTAVTASVAAPERPGPKPVPPARAKAPTTASPLRTAWRALERGDDAAALNEAFDVLARVRAPGDRALLDELAAFASAAVAHTRGRSRSRAEQLVLRVRLARGPAAPAPAPIAPEPARPAPVPPRPPEPEFGEEWGPSTSERAVAWLRAELTGARAFAIAGGAVTLLGVVFLFVLAANRGWVGPEERVALGAAASLAALVAGVALRARYGRVHSALGAVGAGIAGGYATLAAATILYGFLPPWAALLAAGAIAAIGGAIAIAWSSQILAGLALVGAAAAPGLVALDDGITWPGPAFALVVLAATVAVTSRRRWLWLDAVVAGVTVAQVVWLAVAAPLDQAGAIAVVTTTGFVLLAAALAWQAYGPPGLDGPAASFAFAAAGVPLLGAIALVSDDRRLGSILLVLAVAYGVIALAARGWRDLAWVIAAGALLLAGVAVAFLLSGRSLTIVWAIEAAVLAGLAWRLRWPRFQAVSLVYFAAAAVHSYAIEILPDWPAEAFDVPRGAAAGLFVLAVAALVTGLLQPVARADGPSLGIAAALDPLWDALIRVRVTIRAALAASAALFLCLGLAAVLSGRALTLALAALAVVVALAAFLLGERRLQPFALAFYAVAACHAVAVEAPLETLALEDGADALGPVPSLAGLTVAAAMLAALSRFERRGIAWLGEPSGPELAVDVLQRHDGVLRRTLVLLAAVTATWAAGLVAIEIAYAPGQVIATALWSLLGAVVVVLAAGRRSVEGQLAGGAIVVAALVKSGGFDWVELGDDGAAASMLVAAAAVLVSGFACRWRAPDERSPLEVVALACGVGFGVLSVVALGRLVGWETWLLGPLGLAVAGTLAGAGAAPYLRRRAGSDETWLRTLSNGYWLTALGALLFAESATVVWDAQGTLALWGATSALLALAWRPLREERVWLAGGGLGCVTAVATVAHVTDPSRLVDASPHPASGLWVLAVVTGAAWALALAVPPIGTERAQLVIGSAAALTLYGLSLGVLELAVWVSGASVETDFQRGHTALSALWGVGALALYVVGLARDRRDLRVVGLVLFGLALAKLFLYDLSSLSSVTRALSFLAVGAILLAAGFFAERIVRPGGGAGPVGT